MNNIKKLSEILIVKNITISTAESCTGGLLSSYLTDISGSSAYTELNFVTYSNESKNKILGVRKRTLKKYGAVSEQCAKEMCEGLMAKTKSDITLCTTGIAGPTGGSDEKPVGLCYISCKFADKTYIKKVQLASNIERHEMKKQFCKEAIDFALQILTRN